MHPAGMFNMKSNKTPSKNAGQQNEQRTQVRVFCCVRSLQNNTDVSCIKILSNKIISLIPPDTAFNSRSGNLKEIQCSFHKVFAQDTLQEEIFENVALPFVHNLFKGKNSLIFAYGITGSGKTYTMTGKPHSSGIVFRSLDVIFNSIIHLQADKFTFKPDKMNGFEIQNETDAWKERQAELNLYMKRTGCVKRKKKEVETERSGESSTDSLESAQKNKQCKYIEDIDEDKTYAVFVSYVEIYNNVVYDLLEDTVDEGYRVRQLQPKIVREDSSHNMYVHGVIEVEVKCSKEAREIFYRGLRRKHTASTFLNSGSSRGHSVFTIRLVQAPLDQSGEVPVKNKNFLSVSQLCLVDLAGSERTNRTKNTGRRLVESGSINNSLMTLKTCLETLRENQTYGTKKLVPYRDSKLTYLFKNYFEEESYVHTLICVNPRAADYDETIHVMKFAETTKEVQVGCRPASEQLAPSTHLNQLYMLTPGRRRMNQMFQEELKKVEEENKKAAENFEFSDSLNAPFPCMELNDPNNEKVIPDLVMFMEMRSDNRNVLKENIRSKEKTFRDDLMEVEKRNILLSCMEHKNLQEMVEHETKKRILLETKLKDMEGLEMQLQQNIIEKEKIIQETKRKIQEKKMQLAQEIVINERLAQEYRDKFISESDKGKLYMEQKLHEQRVVHKEMAKESNKSFKKVKKIITGEDSSLTSSSESGDIQPVPGSSQADGINFKEPVTAQVSLKPLPEPTESHSSKATSSQQLLPLDSLEGTGTQKIPATGITRRHIPSKSEGDVWLEHRSGIIPADLGTLMQPDLKQCKMIDKLPCAKAVSSSKANKYCLLTQEFDSEGELETLVYKADVVPTTAGGAQFIFNDMEKLTQHSPFASPLRRNSLTESPTAILQKESNTNAVA